MHLVEIVGPFASPKDPSIPYVRCRVGRGWEVKRDITIYGRYDSQQEAVDAAVRMLDALTTPDESPDCID